MFAHRKITDLNEYFSPLSLREGKGVCFGRINCYSENVRAFLVRYFAAARKSGVIIEGKLPNPDEKNLSYYREMMGDGFQLDLEAITGALQKWLPRMNDLQRKNVAESMYSTLLSLQKEGKNEGMLKNATSSSCAGFTTAWSGSSTAWAVKICRRSSMRGRSAAMNF